MKKIQKYKYVIIRLCLFVAFFVVGVMVGLSNRKTKIIKTETLVPEIRTVYVEREHKSDVKEIKVKVTAYCPCVHCSGEFGNMTATGEIAKEGRTIAVDPNVIPYGSTVIVFGKEYIAEDCGAAIVGNEIDIFFENHEEAKEFGVQEIVVFVKEEKK